MTTATITSTERLIADHGIVKTFRVSDRDVSLIADLRRLLLAANADDRDAFQHTGFLYGDLDIALRNLLAKVLDNTEAARMVGEYLLDTYGGTEETWDAIRYGLTRYGQEYGWVPVIEHAA